MTLDRQIDNMLESRRKIPQGVVKKKEKKDQNQIYIYKKPKRFQTPMGRGIKKRTLIELSFQKTFSFSSLKS